MTFLAALFLLATPAWAASRASKEPAVQPATAPTTFALVPTNHELASLWNDPEFQRRLVGSYGFLSEAEPRLNAEELQFYTNKIAPVLKEDPKRAIPLLESQLKPAASAQFDFLLGNVLFQSDDPTNAIKHFESALTKAPDFRRAQKNLAFALMRCQRYEEASKALTRTAALGGGDGRVFGMLGFAYMNLGRFASAEGAYVQALVFEPESVDFRLGCVKCAVATANYDHALALLDELIKQFPERDNLWTLLANIYIQKEQRPKAAITLEMLRRLGKATPQNLFLLGDLYLDREARDLALSAYLEAIEKDGGQNPAKALRPAQVLVSRGAYGEARKLFTKIRGTGGGLSPEDNMKLLKLEAKVALNTGAGDEGIKVLEQIIQGNPLDGEALLLAGNYYAAKETPEMEKAEFRYDTAAKLPGFEADAFLKLAQLKVQARKYTDAVELLRKAQKVKPRDNVQRYLDRVEQLARSGTGRS